MNVVPNGLNQQVHVTINAIEGIRREISNSSFSEENAIVGQLFTYQMTLAYEKQLTKIHNRLKTADTQFQQRTRTQAEWHDLLLLNGFRNTCSAILGQYAKSNGYLMLKGILCHIDREIPFRTPFAKLPEMYRPQKSKMIALSPENTHGIGDIHLKIDSNGEIQLSGNPALYKQPDTVSITSVVSLA